MAKDISLIIGADIGESTAEFQKDLEKIFKSIGEPYKIKLGFDINKSSVDALKQAIKTASSASGSSGAVKDITKYQEATAAAKKYYDYLNKLSSDKFAKQDLSMNSSGYVQSLGGKYTELAEAINTAKRSLDSLTDSSNMGKMSDQEQIRLIQLLVDLEEKYAVASEKSANADIRAIDAAESKAKADAEKAEAQKKAAEAQKQSADAAKAEAEAVKQEAAAAKQAIKTENAKARAIQGYENAIGKAEKGLQNWTKAQNSNNSTSREAYKDLQDQVAKAKDVKVAFDNDEKSTEQLEEATKKLNQQYSITSNTLAETGDRAKTFSERVGGLASKFSTWFSITRVIMSVYNNMKKLVSVSIELEDALAQLQIVTKASDSSMKSYAGEVAQTAKEIGASITDLIESGTTYARLGYTLDESQMLAKYTAMLQAVGDIDVSDAQDAITAIVKAFGVNVDEIESVMDKLVITGKVIARVCGNTH